MKESAPQPQSGSQEEKESQHEIFTRNLEKMRGIKGGDMLEATGSESMGGNAGTTMFEGKKKSCVALNFYANPDTGEIIRFTNHGDINAVFTAINVGVMGKGSYWRVMDFQVRGTMTENAQREIKKAVDAYNDAEQGRYELQ